MLKGLESCWGGQEELREVTSERVSGSNGMRHGIIEKKSGLGRGMASTKVLGCIRGGQGGGEKQGTGSGRRGGRCGHHKGFGPFSG